MSGHSTHTPNVRICIVLAGEPWDGGNVGLQRTHRKCPPAAREFRIPRNFPGYAYRVIPNGIEFRRFRALKAVPRNCGMGGATSCSWARKGRTQRIALSPGIIPDPPNALRRDLRLIIVGPGEPDRACAALLDAAATNDPDSTVVTGPVSSHDLPRYYASADVFCSPATGSESFGIVLLEAMAAGTPVVASDIDGYRDVVTHDVNGLLVPPRDTRP